MARIRVYRDGGLVVEATGTVGETLQEALLDPMRRSELEDLRRRCIHIELAQDPDFMDEFVERMCFEEDD